MNGLLGLFGINFGSNQSDNHPVTLDDNVKHRKLAKPTNIYKRASQKLNQRTIPSDIDADSNDDSSDESINSLPIVGAKRAMVGYQMEWE
jgi:hypothetical protein